MADLTTSRATLPRRSSITPLLKTDMETAQRELFAAMEMLTPEGARVLQWFIRELARLPFAFVVRAIG